MAAIWPSQDRLIRKEAALGFLRERTFPQDHIGLAQFAPFQDAASDDVIFQYLQLNGVGMAPARAEDSEAEMAGKEETFGTGSASIIDWAVKDHYSPSDVSRYRESLMAAGLLTPAGAPMLPLTVASITEGFEQKMATDTARRKTKLDNRLEWLIMQALWTGVIAYNDGKIIFNVDYGRPAAQQNASATVTWDQPTSDPILDIITMQQSQFDLYGVDMTRGLISRRALLHCLGSSKFSARTGLAAAGGPAGAAIDPRYVIDGWDENAAIAIIERATGVKFTVYDSVLRTRAPGAKVLTNKRFSPDDKCLFLPSDQAVAQLDDAIGFGKTLTSGHPEGNWATGWYEWEKDTGPDPWGYDMGTGIKAFPVFPHLDLSVVMKIMPDGTSLQSAY